MFDTGTGAFEGSFGYFKIEYGIVDIFMIPNTTCLTQALEHLRDLLETLRISIGSDFKDILNVQNLIGMHTEDNPYADAGGEMLGE